MEEKEKILCNTCRIETNHLIVGRDEVIEPVIHEGMQYGNSHFGAELLKCLGCGGYTFRTYGYNSEDYQEEIEYEYFPPRNLNLRITKPYTELNFKIRNVYKQTIDAFNSGMNHLCAGGLRALVEAICSAKGIKDGPVLQRDGTFKSKDNLEGKINGLMEAKIMGREAAEVLHTHRIMGNEALHELKEPKKEDLEKNIDVLEHVLDAVFIIPLKNKKLKEKHKKGN